MKNHTIWMIILRTDAYEMLFGEIMDEVEKKLHKKVITLVRDEALSVISSKNFILLHFLS